MQSIREHTPPLPRILKASWPTVRGMDGGQTSRGNDRKDEMLMGGIVKGTWPTPQEHDKTGPRGKNNTFSDHHYGPHDLATAVGTWPCPRAEDSESTGAHRGTPDTLTSAARAAWPTVSVEDCGRQGSLEAWMEWTNEGRTTQCRLRNAVHAGINTSGCLARTESFVVRLATLSAWLMGYTAAYLRLWETASSRRSQRKSSKR